MSLPGDPGQLTLSEPERGGRPSRAVRVYLIVLALAAACRARPDAGVEPPPAVAVAPLRIAMIAKSASNPSFLASRLGAENRARALSAELGRPIEIEWLTPP
ncbi:MAG TPA: hypothetical protein VLC06_12585, partial [Polyangia bacterium]|nr:hypothetical protein [Polyangia bacterium]